MKIEEKSERIWQYTLEYDEIGLESIHVEKAIGYQNGAPPEHFQELIHQAMEGIRPLAQIQGGYRWIENFRTDGASCWIQEQKFQTGRIIGSQLRNAESIAIFVCTVGPEIEQWSKALMQQGDITLGYIVDATASELVELAMDKIQNHMESQMQNFGLGITNRFSPGYCGWSVSEQHLLFSLLPEKFCGVTLTPSALMVPIKSISGVIGIGPHAKRMEYPCKKCDQTQCIYRRRMMEKQ